AGKRDAVRDGARDAGLAAARRGRHRIHRDVRRWSVDGDAAWFRQGPRHPAWRRAGERGGRQHRRLSQRARADHGGRRAGARAGAALREPGVGCTVEPGVYIKELGGFRHSDTVVITADGRRVMTDYPRDLKELTITP